MRKIISFLLLLLGVISLNAQSDEFPLDFGGRLAIDYNAFNYAFQDSTSSSQHIGIRHAWLTAKKRFDSHFSMKMQVVLQGATISLFDIYLQYNSLDGNHMVTFGNLKLPIRLSSLNSNLEFMMMERTTDEYFVPVRDIGLLYKGQFADSKIGLQAGLFATNTTYITKFAIKPSIRLSVMPVDNQSFVHQLYLAAAYADRADQKILFYQINPSMRNSLYNWSDPDESTYYVNDAYGFDLFYAFKSLYLEGEYLRVRAADSYANYDTGYVTLGFFLTGESKKIFNHYAGVVATSIKKPLNEGGVGAFEIGVRYSQLRADESIRLDSFDEYSVGLNWYPFNRVKLMLEYNRMIKNNIYLDDLKSISSFGTRFQVRF